MKVVFDTNIFVSALVFPGSRAEDALLRIIKGDDRLILSKAILDELLSVLAGKFSRDREELSRVAVWLDDIAEWVTPSRRLKVLKDEPDNRILECAVAGGAARIVTGDHDSLRLRNFEGIAIVTLREYLTREEP